MQSHFDQSGKTGYKIRRPETQKTRSILISALGFQQETQNPGHHTPWLVIVVLCSPSCCRVTVPSCRTKEGAPSTQLSMGTLPGTTSYLSPLCNRDSRSPHRVNYASTSQQLLTSCSTKLPEDRKSSSVYLHLKRQRALTSSKTSQSRHKIVSATQWVYNFYSLSQVQRKGMGPRLLRKWNRSFFFFLEPSSDNRLEQG